MSSRKRSHDAIEPPSPRRRVRNGTPIVIEVQSTSVERDDPDASGYAYPTTTIAGPSSYANRPEVLSKTEGGPTSEGGEEGSVLFSEQGVQASGSTVVKGNLEYYIPQPYGVGGVAETEETDATGEYVEEVQDGEEEEEEQGVEDEDELDESHDRQDDEDREEDGVINAEEEAPAWTKTEEWKRATRPPNLDGVLARMEEGLKQDRKRRKRNGIPEVDVESEEMMESYHSGDTELYEMDHRPALERTAVKRDIRAFEGTLDHFRDEQTKERLFKVVDRLGEGALWKSASHCSVSSQAGTFSSVYLAHDVFFHYYNNSHWAWSPDDITFDDIEESRSRVPVALKKILVTSSPARIENELAILESLRWVAPEAMWVRVLTQCRGCRNVSKLITAFRDDDQVIIVMPYEQCDDFRVSDLASAFREPSDV